MNSDRFVKGLLVAAIVVVAILTFSQSAADSSATHGHLQMSVNNDGVVFFDQKSGLTCIYVVHEEGADARCYQLNKLGEPMPVVK